MLTNTDSTILSPAEAARALGIRLDGVYTLIWCGKLSAHKEAGRWRIPKQAIIARQEKLAAAKNSRHE